MSTNHLYQLIYHALQPAHRVRRLERQDHHQLDHGTRSHLEQQHHSPMEQHLAEVAKGSHLNQRHHRRSQYLRALHVKAC